MKRANIGTTRTTGSSKSKQARRVAKRTPEKIPEMITSAEWSELFKIGDRAIVAVQKEVKSHTKQVAALMVAVTTIAYMNHLSKDMVDRSLNLAWRTSFGRFGLM